MTRVRLARAWWWNSDGETLRGHTFANYNANLPRFHVIPEDANRTHLRAGGAVAVAGIFDPSEYKEQKSQDLEKVYRGSRRPGARTEECMGDYYFENHDYQHAIKHYRAQVRERGSPRLHRKIVSAQYNIGINHIKAHHYERALEYMEAVLEAGSAERRRATRRQAPAGHRSPLNGLRWSSPRDSGKLFHFGPIRYTVALSRNRSGDRFSCPPRPVSARCSKSASTPCCAPSPPDPASPRRAIPEEEDAYRTVYQRDRDRILHTKAFRRLKRKTQVFLAPTGDHFRTRLTHTLEVAQISRTRARAVLERRPHRGYRARP